MTCLEVWLFKMAAPAEPIWVAVVGKQFPKRGIQLKPEEREAWDGNVREYDRSAPTKRNTIRKLASTLKK